MDATVKSTGMKFDIGRAAHAVAKALDCVGIDDRNHGSRVGLLCHRLCEIMGYSPERCYSAMLSGLLHDCGVSSTVMHEKLVLEMEWEGAQEHCVLGEEYLLSFRPFHQFATLIRYHHTRWENLPTDIGWDERLGANMIFLLDRFDVLFAIYRLENPAYQILREKEKVLGQLRPHVGTLFEPSLFQALEDAALHDSLWLELQDEYLNDAVTECLDEGAIKEPLTLSEVEDLGVLLSHIVDAKSAFTHNHSLRVADLSHALAELLGYDDEECRIMRIVGLLHDVGKLRTPDRILDKPGPLQPDEQAQIRCHPMDSKRVLKGIFPGSSICKWVSEHHEKLNGSGYPYGYTPQLIERPSRVLAVADIFQALCQDRPYRGRLELNQVISIMDKMMNEGEIDPKIYQLVVDNKNEFYEMAIA